MNHPLALSKFKYQKQMAILRMNKLPSNLMRPAVAQIWDLMPGGWMFFLLMRSGWALFMIIVYLYDMMG